MSQLFSLPIVLSSLCFLLVPAVHGATIALEPGAGAEIKNIGIFDESGALLSTVTHPEDIRSIAYHPTTGDVYAYLQDGVYRNGVLLFAQSGTFGAQNQGSNIAVSFSGLIALEPGAGAEIKNIGIFDESGALLSTVTHPEDIRDIAFSPVSDDIYAYLQDGVYRNGVLLFAQSGTLGAQNQGSDISVSSSGLIALAPEAGADIKNIGIFDQSGSLISTVTLPEDIRDIAFDSSSDDVYAYLQDGVYRNGLLLFAQSGTFGAQNTGSRIAVFSPVPIPPAVWLFGSALGVMGVMRRKISS